MNVRGCRVHAEVDAQRLSAFHGRFELGFHLGFRNDFGCASFQVSELFFDGFEFRWRHGMNSVTKHAAAGDFEFSLQNDSNRLGINAMLLLQDFFGEGRLSVVVEHGNGGLQNDRAGIEVFVHEMYGAAGKFHAVFEGLALRFKAGERREQRRMNVQDAVWIFGDKKWGEQPHVSRQTNQINFVFVENGGDLAIVSFALQAFRRDHARANAARFGALDARCAFAIADDDGDFRIGNAARRDAFRERLEVRAAAAQEHAYALVHKRKTLTQFQRYSKPRALRQRDKK